MLSPIAVTLLTYISCSYVFVLYLASREAAKYRTKRDDPRVIKKRMRNLIGVMVINLFVVPLIQSRYGSNYNNVSYIEAFLNIGVIPGHYITGEWDILSYILDIVKTIGLISLLYISQLVDLVLYYIVTRFETLITDVIEQFNNIWGVRNYIFAPCTEEIFYTSMLLTTYLAFDDQGGLTYNILLWQPSIFFGIAHAHHAIEMINNGTHAIAGIFVSVIFQVLYTTLFGAMTNYTFLRSGGNLWACVLLHVFCNLMGFPGGSHLTLHLDVIDKQKDPIVERLVAIWNKVYVLLTIFGVILYFQNVQVLTESPIYGIHL